MSKKPKRRRRVRRAGKAIGAVAFVFAAVLAWNAWRAPAMQLDVKPVAKLQLDEDAAARKLSKAIGIRTVSDSNPARIDTKQFDRFHDFIRETYPQLHQAPLEVLTGEAIGDQTNRSLLFRWPGRDLDLEPILLMSHYDVVPVDPDTASAWTHPPFAGEIAKHFIWGRGTLDVKDGAIAILESIQNLLDSGFQPTRTIYVSLGHDEETGGTRGNGRTAAWMRSQGIRFWFVADEGGCIVNDFPGLGQPLALVGVAEKGFLNVRLSVSLEDGGHSSMPPSETAVGILAQAINRIERNPFPATLDGGADLLLDFVGPEMGLVNRIAISNRWLFKPLIVQMLEKTPSSNALLRTTVAPTMVSGGTKENMIATHAEATLNLRILPGDSTDSAVERLRAIVGDDRVEVETFGPSREPSPLSSTRSDSFGVMHQTIREIYPDVAVAPFVLVGGTDASHYEGISRNVYRFMPVRLDQDDLKRIHGIDERIAKRAYFDLIRYFTRLIKNAS